VARELGGFAGKMSLLDSYEGALECAKFNLELFGAFGKLNTQNADIIDLWQPVSGTPTKVVNPK